MEKIVKEILISMIIIFLLVTIGVFGAITEGFNILAYIAIAGLLIMIIYIPFQLIRIIKVLNLRRKEF